MRITIRIFYVFLTLCLLSILFPSAVRAGCYFNSYNQCTGTCSCSCGGNCTCQLDGWGNCEESGCNTNCCQYTCRKYECRSDEEETSDFCSGVEMICYKPKTQPTNPPPTSSAQPTNTPQPTTGGMQCTSSTQCYSLLHQKRQADSSMQFSLYQRPLLHHPTRHQSNDNRRLLSLSQ